MHNKRIETLNAEYMDLQEKEHQLLNDAQKIGLRRLQIEGIIDEYNNFILSDTDNDDKQQ